MTGWAATNTLRYYVENFGYETRPMSDGHLSSVPIKDAPALAALALVETALDAADAWWASKRPIDWAEEQHRAEPFVNCVGPQEQSLAAALRAVREGA